MFADKTSKGPSINDIVSGWRVGGPKKLVKKTHVLPKKTPRGWRGEKIIDNVVYERPLKLSRKYEI